MAMDDVSDDISESGGGGDDGSDPLGANTDEVEEEGLHPLLRATSGTWWGLVLELSKWG